MATHRASKLLQAWYTPLLVRGHVGVDERGVRNIAVLSSVWNAGPWWKETVLVEKLVADGMALRRVSRNSESIHKAREQLYV